MLDPGFIQFRYILYSLIHTLVLVSLDLLKIERIWNRVQVSQCLNFFLFVFYQRKIVATLRLHLQLNYSHPKCWKSRLCWFFEFPHLSRQHTQTSWPPRLEESSVGWIPARSPFSALSTTIFKSRKLADFSLLSRAQISPSKASVHTLLAWTSWTAHTPMLSPTFPWRYRSAIFSTFAWECSHLILNLIFSPCVAMRHRCRHQTQHRSTSSWRKSKSGWD